MSNRNVVLILVTYSKINEIAIIPISVEGKNWFWTPPSKKNSICSCLGTGETFVSISELSFF